MKATDGIWEREAYTTPNEQQCQYSETPQVACDRGLIKRARTSDDQAIRLLVRHGTQDISRTERHPYHTGSASRITRWLCAGLMRIQWWLYRSMPQPIPCQRLQGDWRLLKRGAYLHVLTALGARGIPRPVSPRRQTALLKRRPAPVSHGLSRSPHSTRFCSANTCGL